jgi:hypothetical protein
VDVVIGRASQRYGGCDREEAERWRAGDPMDPIREIPGKRRGRPGITASVLTGTNRRPKNRIHSTISWSRVVALSVDSSKVVRAEVVPWRLGEWGIAWETDDGFEGVDGIGKRSEAERIVLDIRRQRVDS